MENDKLESLFGKFEPELSSDSVFMERLQRSMDSVEFVTQHNEALRKRNKTAMLIAGAFGFILGTISTLLFPILANRLSSVHLTIPEFSIVDITITPSMIGSLALATVCVIITTNVYELALAKLTPKSFAKNP